MAAMTPKFCTHFLFPHFCTFQVATFPPKFCIHFVVLPYKLISIIRLPQQYQVASINLSYFTSPIYFTSLRHKCFAQHFIFGHIPFIFCPQSTIPWNSRLQKSILSDNKQTCRDKNCQWFRRHNESLHSVLTGSNIVSIIKLGWLSWLGILLLFISLKTKKCQETKSEGEKATNN
jgi:hypothetical protein